jgi:putative SOS response-associated peptidase YedK
MCGRFTLIADPEQIRQAFPWLTVPDGIQPHFNVAPTQPVAVVPNNGQNKLDFFVWGLIPSWAKDPEIGSRMINARAETLLEKPSFRTAFRRRRCLVLADGFYEWRTDQDDPQNPGRKVKTPMYIRLRNGRPFAFAGLWEEWNSPDGSQILSCTIITTRPNALMSQIHNRMPVILPEASYPLWLAHNEVDPAELAPLLQPYPVEEMSAMPVSRLVNNPANNLPDCVLPLAE